MTSRIGYGFMTGCVAGAVIYFGYGLYLAPRGQRFATGLVTLRDRSPILGGSIALWSGGFAATGGLVGYYR